MYLDASVIVRALLTDEVGWEQCAEVLADENHVLVTAPWTRVECQAALFRAARGGRIEDPYAATDSLRRVLLMVAEVMPPLDELMTGATAMVYTHWLRALDAMHLAAASRLRFSLTGVDDEFAFASTDHSLMGAARNEGMPWPGELVLPDDDDDGAV